MAESKGSPGRFSSFRDSVKKITERLADKDSDMMKRSDDANREVEKLRLQIQAMEEELRQLHHSRSQLDQASDRMTSLRPRCRSQGADRPSARK